MFLSLETLTFIIRTGLPILMELIDLVKSFIILLSQMTLLKCLAFLLTFQVLILDHESCSFGFLSFFWCKYLSTTTFRSLGNSNQVVVSVCTDFPSNSQPDAPSPCIAYEYSRADGMVLVIILVTFLWMISLKLVFLLLLVNFVSRFRLELTYISLI